MTKIKKLLENKEELLLIAISVLFGLIVFFAPLENDDVAVLPNIGNTIKDCWKWAIDQYSYWGARQIINFIWAVMLVKGKKLWALFMSLSMYVLLKSSFVLFRKKEDNGLLLAFLIFLTLQFPFYSLCTAGWIATSTSYFCPQSFAILSLITIKKSMMDERITIPEMLLYCSGLIYGANAEQMCVVLLVLNLVAFVYLLIKKKKAIYVGIQLVLAIGSCIYFITCPGNSFRGDITEAAYFPTYRMLDIVDKLDIGLSTTLKWMLIDNNLFIIVFCCMCAYFIWKKYDTILFRVISIIPAATVVMFGPCVEIVKKFYPQLIVMTQDINYYGSFTVENQGMGVDKYKFAIFLLITLCVLIELILLNDTVENMIIDICLAVVAVGSRVMMAFSGSIYASGSRTNTTLFFGFLILMLHIFNNNEKQINNKNAIICFCVLGMVISFANLIFLVRVGI